MARFLPLGLLLAVVTCVLLPSRARAEAAGPQATPLVVLDIDSEDAEDQAEALTASLRSRVRSAARWSLVEPSTTGGTQALGTLIVALKCTSKPDAACLQRIADQLHADHFIWGQLARSAGSQVTVELHLWTRGKPDAGLKESYTDNLKDPSDENLRKLTAKLFAKLTGTNATGSLVVHAGTESGTIVINGVPQGKLEGGNARLEIAAGTHLVEVRIAGFTAPARQVVLDAGSEAELTFVLTAAKSEPNTPPPAPFPVRKVVGFSAVGVGAALLAVGGIEGLRFLSERSDLDDARAKTPTTIQNLCDDSITPTTEAGCRAYNSAKKARTLAIVFSAIGGVVAGAGLVVLLTDPGPPKPTAGKVQVSPHFGPAEGGVDLSVRF